MFNNVIIEVTVLQQGNLLTDKTEIVLIGGSVKKSNIFKTNTISFENIDIGGLDQQFIEIFTRVFSTRMIPDKTFKKLGICHVKGVLLYGP